MKRPTAKAIGLPDVGGEFGSCSVSLMDFTEFDLQRIPYSSHASYLRRNFARFLALDTNVWGYYNKLVAFIPIAKDV
ncbi:hypothetical protein [Helicobacter pylori]|uniref:hypothetical protein n=1 Tax=Helicobacter pylori TaxID=210 RepID=UPI003F93EE4D